MLHGLPQEAKLTEAARGGRGGVWISSTCLLFLNLHCWHDLLQLLPVVLLKVWSHECSSVAVDLGTSALGRVLPDWERGFYFFILFSPKVDSLHLDIATSR